MVDIGEGRRMSQGVASRFCELTRVSLTASFLIHMTLLGSFPASCLRCCRHRGEENKSRIDQIQSVADRMPRMISHNIHPLPWPTFSKVHLSFTVGRADTDKAVARG